MSLRVLVVDDEPLARDCVLAALEREPDIVVVGECGDGEAAVAALATTPTDLVFLDLQMPGLDGFGVIERVGAARMPAVIFATAYQEHAVRAFAVHALDYVLKPFDDARLRDALAHARARLAIASAGGELTERLLALLQSQKETAGAVPATFARWLTATDQSTTHFIPVDEIDWFEAEGNYVQVHVRERAYLLRATLTNLARRLDPTRFVRIHRSTVVHLARVRTVEPWSGGDFIAVLHDGQQLKVSRRYREPLLRPLI